MKKLDTGTGFGDQKINRYTKGMATLYKIKKQVQVPGTVFPNNFSNGPGTRYNDSLLQVPYCYTKTQVLKQHCHSITPDSQVLPALQN